MNEELKAEIIKLLSEELELEVITKDLYKEFHVIRLILDGAVISEVYLD